MTREIETWLSGSMVGNNNVVDHRRQRPDDDEDEDGQSFVYSDRSVSAGGCTQSRTAQHCAGYSQRARATAAG